MEYFVLDFLVGIALMNAMPHLIFGITKVRFLSPFGFTPAANIGYSAVNVLIAVVLFQLNRGFAVMIENGIFLGAVFILIVYFISGKFFYRLFQSKTDDGNPGH